MTARFNPATQGFMHRFDSLTQFLSSRATRRAAVLGSSAAVISTATIGAVHV
jgi:hypothetical protein